MVDGELGSAAPVVPLHPIRTLVIARDLAFRQRAAAVLANLGALAFAVGSPEVTDDVIALIRRERPDVVVLDCSGSARAVGQVVYDLSLAVPRVGVVLVGGRDDRTHQPQMLDKWGWATELANAVQVAYHRGNPLKEAPADVHERPC